MSGNSSGTKHAHSRIDTMIGAGVHVEGHMTFTGVLRLEGEALGNVLCDADSNGMILVGKSGVVTGAIKAPHVVVGGRVAGPVDSSESVEIQAGGRVAGDVSYREIEIHPGGVIDGALMPGVPPHRDAQGERESGATLAHVRPAGHPPGEGIGRGRVIGAAAVLLVVAVAAVWMSREPAPPGAPTSTTAPSRIDPSAVAVPAAPLMPAAGAAQQDAAKESAADVAAALHGTVAVASGAVQPSPPDLREVADPEKLVLVQGVNPGKPAGIVLVIAKEPAVLFKKKRQDAADGARIDIAPGVSENVAIARTDVLRVAKGSDLALFYQGRKVSQRDIDSGTWMSFVPQASAPTRAADEK